MLQNEIHNFARQLAKTKSAFWQLRIKFEVGSPHCFLAGSLGILRSACQVRFCHVWCGLIGFDVRLAERLPKSDVL
jgi:hypothetical protein